jgi:hypothetical protein
MREMSSAETAECVTLCLETSSVISACLGARNCRQAELFLLGNADQLCLEAPGSEDEI